MFVASTKLLNVVSCAPYFGLGVIANKFFRFLSYFLFLILISENSQKFSSLLSIKYHKNVEYQLHRAFIAYLKLLLASKGTQENFLHRATQNVHRLHFIITRLCGKYIPSTTLTSRGRDGHLTVLSHYRGSRCECTRLAMHARSYIVFQLLVRHSKFHIKPVNQTGELFVSGNRRPNESEPWPIMRRFQRHRSIIQSLRFSIFYARGSVSG